MSAQLVPDLAAVVLAAGEGQRLRPLTESCPKALCPVGNVPLLDRALLRLAALGLAGPDEVAVNAHYLGEQVVRQVGQRAHISRESHLLGTSGSLGKLRDWIDGRPVLVGNADAYLSPNLPDPADPGKPPDLPKPPELVSDIAGLVSGWDGQTVRMLGVPATADRPAEFGSYRFAGFSLLPWSVVVNLLPEPSNLVRTVWRPAEREGKFEVVPYPGCYLDTGTAADYLAANLHAANGSTLLAEDALVSGTAEHCVIGAGAQVHGKVSNCVVWPGGVVEEHETLDQAIRVGRNTTVFIRENR